MKQLERWRKERALISYLERRTIASLTQRGLDWVDFTLALSIEVMNKCGKPTSKATKMKVLYDKYDDDRYKLEDKKRYCPLCEVNGSDDLTDHLFNCCPADEAQRITNLAIAKFDNTPLSDITLQHPNSKSFKAELRLMLLSQHSCRIGRFNSSHRNKLINTMGSMTDTYSKHLHRDLVKLVGIFAAATFELVELRNSTRASTLALGSPEQLRTEAGSVWVQVPPKKHNTGTVGKQASPAANPIKRLWDAYKSKNNNPFSVLADDTSGVSRNDDEDDSSIEPTTELPAAHKPLLNSVKNSRGTNEYAATNAEEYKVQNEITITIDTPGHIQLAKIQQGDTLDGHIHLENDSYYHKYLVTDPEQVYTTRITPSNRAAPEGCVSSLYIPDGATVIARPSYPPMPISPKRLIQAHRFTNNLRWAFYGWREVRGDGNCYYRAIYFAVMERAIGLQEFSSSLLLGIYTKFVEIEDTLLSTYSEQNIEHYRQLMEDLREQRSMFDSVMDFEDYLITNPGIEIAYICVMRSIMGRILLNHETTISPEQLELIKQFYGYTDENIETLWAEKIWSEQISPLGMEADGPLVQLHAIPTFLSVGCQLYSLSENGTQGTKNELFYPLINISIILIGGHYDITYYRIFGNNTNVFENLGEKDPVNQLPHPPPVYNSDGSSQSNDYEDPSLGYAEHPD